MKSFAFAVLLFLIAATIRADDSKSPFVLSVVPSRSGASGPVISAAKERPGNFYVVLTNVSDRPQPVWETWNSWGYDTISLEIVLPGGKPLPLTKKPADFTKNFPSVFIIPPGERQVYPIQLDDEWINRPVFSDAGDTPISLKAIYSVPASKEGTEYGVWAGRVESVIYKLSLRHW